MFRVFCFGNKRIMLGLCDTSTILGMIQNTLSCISTFSRKMMRDTLIRRKS